MRNTIFFLFFFILPCLCIGQAKEKIFTKWEGLIDKDELVLKFVFKLTNGKCLLDVPGRAVQEYPSSKFEKNGDSIHIAFSGMISADFVGMSQKDTLIVGRWIQSGESYPLELQKKEYKRPQNPQSPFPYQVEDIIYFNQDKSIQFGGTLTTPKNESGYPVAILISGSGQQDRDETLYGHKPFLVIADYLTRNGIAVLRIDDRGIGKTTGNETLNDVTSFDFAQDVFTSIEYLKKRGDINPNQIGLIGHSEGGLIATIVGSMRKDVAFIVSLAGVGVTGEKIMLSQIEESLKRSMFSPSIDSILIFEKKAIDIINQENNNSFAEQDIVQMILGKRLTNQDSLVKKYFGMELKDGFETYNAKSLRERYKMRMLPWYRYFLSYNPEEYLPKVNAPFLALNGEKDTQVLADLNLNGFRDTFDRCGKKNYKVVNYPGLNHFFQHCKTGFYDEVESIEETISPKVLNDMAAWIKEQVENNN